MKINSLSKHMLATTALTAACLVAPSAMAFEQSAWSWQADVSQSNSTTANSALDAFPSGLATADALQMMVGDSHTDVSLEVGVTPPTDPLNPSPNDALADLGWIEGASGSYGNVFEVGGEVPITARTGQFHVGGYDPTVTDPTVSASTDTTLDGTLSAGVNPHAILLQELRDQSEAGLLTPHTTLATGEAFNATDVTLALDARAVSNSVGFQLSAAAPQALGTAPVTNADGTVSYSMATDAILTADATQFSYGNVEAIARTSQMIGNFGGIGQIDRPLASLNATSIGNLGTAMVDIASP
jgi:hypothetical protein